MSQQPDHGGGAQARDRQHRPRLHLRHHAARRRAVPRRHHDLRGEAGGGRLPRRDGRRHHRGGLPDRVARATSRPCPRSPSALKRAVVCGLSRAGETRHRPGRRGGEARRAAAHPHLHLHLAGAPQVQAAEVGRAGAGDGALPGQPRPQLGGRTWSGRPRTPPAPRSTTCAAAWRRPSRPAPPPSTCPTRWAMRRRRNTSRCSAP